MTEFHKIHAGSKFDTFIVPTFGSGWNETKYRALLHLCLIFGVKKLIFGKSTRDQDGQMFESYAKPGFVFLSHLREIELYTLKIPHAFPVVISNSRVKKITWNSTIMNDTFILRLPITILNEMWYKIHQIVDTNWSVQEFYFTRPVNDAIEVTSLCHFGLNKGSYAQQAIYKCKFWMDNNGKAFRKCQSATMTMLGLIRQKKVKSFDLVGRHVMKIVSLMIWETRGTKVWTQ
jgi:hypothetical protein